MIDFQCREGVFFDFLDIIKIQIREEIPGEGEVVMEKRVSTRSIVITGMFAAVIAVLAQVALPMPSGVPVTLQTFAIALTGVVLGAGGLGILFGKSGGFIWGFLFLALLCGLGCQIKNKVVGWGLGIVGLAVCHLLGIFQFMVLMKMGVAESALLVSVPFLIKDVVSVAFAFVLGLQIRKQLFRADILQGAAPKKATVEKL